MTPAQLELIPEEREAFVSALPPELHFLALDNDGLLPPCDCRGRARCYEAQRGLLCPGCANKPLADVPYWSGIVFEDCFLVCDDCGKVTRNGEWRVE